MDAGRRLHVEGPGILGRVSWRGHGPARPTSSDEHPPGAPKEGDRAKTPTVDLLTLPTLGRPMRNELSSEEPLSLLGITLRRASVSGRFFLVYGSAVSVLLGVSLVFTAGRGSFPSAFPLFLPIFGVMGSMGGLIVFTNDRTKGVLEYLLAYGFSPRRLFANVLVTALALASIVLAVGLGVGLGFYLARGYPFTPQLALALGLYAIPMTLASVAFAATVGVYWTALSSPRQGMSSPIGLVPFVGILPSVATLGIIIELGLSGRTSDPEVLTVLGTAIAAIAAIVLVLLSKIGTLLRRERMLSSA